MTQRTRTPSRTPARGFALVTVLACLVLLTLVVVGLLNLSSIALRSAGQTTYVARAQANARLALMLALGDLQRQAGPDTRATAAASILAKQHRDAIMHAAALQWPHYGWDRNAGYGTREHMEALTRLGPTPHHRRSFAPVAQACLLF